MSKEEFNPSEPIDFYQRFHSPLAQELMRLHFAQRVESGIISANAQVLPDVLDDGYRTPEEADKLAREMAGAEFPLLVIADTDSETGMATDLSLVKIDLNTGCIIHDAWVSVVGVIDDGNIVRVYQPWTDDQAALVKRQGEEQALVDIDPRQLYVDGMEGWSK